ncbi:class I SAM-dependent methyltransferase [Bosea psychrotolerans]|uniref:Phosphatidylethanolamine/phosphatidyl-N-methylethanolamine N-methyltransferase n=1 Tax=Bosea psychrotolerans TaxID=1871628 RepID=A0A2S4M6I3_9HYPH|nr:methyltransferase domain-containing protein [Bosea psychrotolerans]POR50312.1 phosphatidylethanolamine/phosphatidyl-N-methylethanolamine N-methyltransferase [Bosea psychrotolerans]
MAVRIEDEVRVTAADLVDSMAEARLRVAAVRYKVEGEVRQKAEKFKTHVSRVAGEAKSKLSDEARFIRSWIDDPGRTGSVTPSSPFLARRMASFVDPAIPGPVIEIGPGTGPVTEALIERGISEDRLILVEYSPEFCALLRQRFPRATVVEGDAYALSTTLAGHLQEKAIAVVSSLPLFNRPPAMRSALAKDAFTLLVDGAPLIQFTYSVISPVPRKGSGLKAFASDWVLRNIPPARVWVYRQAT